MTAHIRQVDDMAAGLAALRIADPALARVHEMAGDPPLRLSQPGLAGLVGIIVAQQVSVASARAIQARTDAVFAPVSARKLQDAGDDDYRRAGLSMPKIRTMRAVAAAVLDGFDFDGLGDLSAGEAHARLTAIKGIGPWTADVYLLFCLGHADGFAAGDLALQEAARLAFDLPARPSAGELAALAERWRPWRGIAARLLWAYYARMKGWRDAAPISTEETA